MCFITFLCFLSSIYNAYICSALPLCNLSMCTFVLLLPLYFVPQNTPLLNNCSASPDMELVVFNDCLALPDMELILFNDFLASPDMKLVVFNDCLALPNMEITVFNDCLALHNMELVLLENTIISHVNNYGDDVSLLKAIKLEYYRKFQYR